MAEKVLCDSCLAYGECDHPNLTVCDQYENKSNCHNCEHYLNYFYGKCEITRKEISEDTINCKDYKKKYIYGGK